MTNKPNGTLYIGHTDDLARRVFEHQNHLIKGFTSRYNLERLVWYDVFETREAAKVCESRMKKWYRSWKVKRIEAANPNWDNLTHTQEFSGSLR